MFDLGFCEFFSQLSFVIFFSLIKKVDFVRIPGGPAQELLPDAARQDKAGP